MQNPGILKSKAKEKKECIYKILNKYILENLFALLSVFDNLEICPECITYKAPRSKHCEICEACIKVYDHHCPWIDNCVKLIVILC